MLILGLELILVLVISWLLAKVSTFISILIIMNKDSRIHKPSNLRYKWVVAGDINLESGFSYHAVFSGSLPICGLHTTVFQPTGLFNSLEEAKAHLAEFLSFHFSNSLYIVSRGKIEAFIFKIYKIGSYSQ